MVHPGGRGRHGAGGTCAAHALVPAAAHVTLLWSGSRSFAALEDLDRLPLSPAASSVSKMVLEATLSVLTFLQEHGAAAAGAGECCAVTVSQVVHSLTLLATNGAECRSNHVTGKGRQEQRFP